MISRRFLIGLVIPLSLMTAPLRAADDYKLGPDSLPQTNVPKGELLKGTYTAKLDSVFPGTVRDYTIYLPPNLDKTKPAPFMVFQDGVLYQAPTVFDNLIAKKEIPPLIGIFIKPGVVPAANDNALPRFNRSYEYDSVTDTYARFLIEECLPAISKTHSLHLSTDPNDAAISGNSSGGICAFMVAWHRPDRFRRVFTGVGTYVGIHGADQLPVLIRKMEPKPLRVFLQSGTGDNNLYCGDWWMANQTMERSLTWAGYEVNHVWGEGGHNQKHATAIFPDALRWLWAGWPERKELKANPRGDSKWKGYEVAETEKGWQEVVTNPAAEHVPPWAERLPMHLRSTEISTTPSRLAAMKSGDVIGWLKVYGLFRIHQGEVTRLPSPFEKSGVNWASDMLAVPDGSIQIFGRTNGPAGNEWQEVRVSIKPDGSMETLKADPKTVPQEEKTGIRKAWSPVCRADGMTWGNTGNEIEPVDPMTLFPKEPAEYGTRGHPDRWSSQIRGGGDVPMGGVVGLAFSPDQSLLYLSNYSHPYVHALQIFPDGKPGVMQAFFQLEGQNGVNGCGRMCVDTEGRLYVATTLGIQVCDQAGRVNFILPTEHLAQDICFGGPDLSELFIACGNKVYKRSTKVHGIVSGQMAPIKPKPPHL